MNQVRVTKMECTSNEPNKNHNPKFHSIEKRKRIRTIFNESFFKT
jgi:hypothetical protein